MDQTRLHEIEARCTQESPPHCQAACPFNLDVRAFMARMAEGRPAEARKILERHLPLPGILARICDHPCENVCLRLDLGGSLAIHALEHACVYAVGTQSRPLPMPRKKFSLAVLGAGLAGLAAAWDLSRKGYPVTVFYQGDAQSVLLEQYPALRPDREDDPLAGDWELLGRQKLTFSPAALDEDCLARVAAEFDGVLIDAGAAPGLAPNFAPAEDTPGGMDAVDGMNGVDALTLYWRDNICCAGWLSRTPTGHVYASASAQAGQGRRAAQTLERLVGKVSLTAAREKVQGPLHTPLDGIAPLARVDPSGPVYTTEEAALEAGRCLQCQCLICVRECVYLQKYKGYPRVYARQIHNNASIVKGLHTANALVNGCALCGQCEELCPENFSMAELCLAAREDMVQRDFMPPSAHEFALEDMENASGPECALTLPDVALPEGACASWLFFPGCQLAASRGEQTAALYAFLRAVLPYRDGEGGVSLLLSCCGIPARWAGREALFKEHTAEIRKEWEVLGRPRIMAACSSCLSALRLALPEARPVSVWEVLNGLPLPPEHVDGLAKDRAEAALPKVFSVHDPCTARWDGAWLEAVRGLARKCGARLEEPRLTGATTACCGYGGLVWCAQPELAQAMSEHRAAELPYPALASCIMCRDRLVADGKECWHLLDLLFPASDGGESAGRGTRRGPGLSARRANRAALRRRLLRDYLGENLPEPAPGALHVPPDLLARLEEKHILLLDVEEAVAGVEACGQYFENQENGHRLGSWRPRQVTFWVEYGRENGELVLYDAWCHRMRVPGSGGPGGPGGSDAGDGRDCCEQGGASA